MVIDSDLHRERREQRRGEMAEQGRVPDSTHRGGSSATPLDPPSNSPHISGKVVSLSLSDYDRTIVLTEIQRLEVVSLVAHVEGSRPNRPELRRMLYASFPEEINNIVDIQFMGKGCFHLEFTDSASVDRLLAIKHTSLHGSWISFYRWTHNVVAEEILQHKEAHMIFTAVFPGLKKEWHQVVAQIGALLGNVIAIRDEASQEDDRRRGTPAVKILAPRNSVLPSSVLLPNLQKNKEPLPQKILYQGLPDQCFICRHFGHLGKDCPRKRFRSEEASKSTSKGGKSDWTPIAAKHSFKHFNSPVNSIVLFDCNQYNTLNSDEGRNTSSQNSVKEKNKVVEIQSLVTSKQDQEVMIKESKDNHHKFEVSSILQSKDNQLGDKGKNIIQSLPCPEPQDKGHQVEYSGVDMDCEKQLPLVLYEEDSSKQKPLSPLKTMFHQDINEFSFSTEILVPEDNSTLEKAMPVRTHKYSGKDMMITRRQLRVVEEGKRRGVVLAGKRIVS